MRGFWDHPLKCEANRGMTKYGQGARDSLGGYEAADIPDCTFHCGYWALLT